MSLFFYATHWVFDKEHIHTKSHRLHLLKSPPSQITANCKCNFCIVCLSFFLSAFFFFFNLSVSRTCLSSWSLHPVIVWHTGLLCACVWSTTTMADWELLLMSGRNLSWSYATAGKTTTSSVGEYPCVVGVASHSSLLSNSNQTVFYLDHASSN